MTSSSVNDFLGLLFWIALPLFVPLILVIFARPFVISEMRRSAAKRDAWEAEHPIRAAVQNFANSNFANTRWLPPANGSDLSFQFTAWTVSITCALGGVLLIFLSGKF